MRGRVLDILVPLSILVALTLVFTFMMFLLVDLSADAHSFAELQRISGSDLTRKEIEQLVRKEPELHPAKTFVVGYLRALAGDFGISRASRIPVAEIITETRGEEPLPRIMVTIALMLASLIVTLLFAIPIGILSALKKNRVVDVICSIVTMLSKSVPFFMLAFMLMFRYSFILGVLPASGAANWRHFVLPVVVLAFSYLGFATQAVRATTLDAIRSGSIGFSIPRPYVREKRPFQNAMLPTVAQSGLQLGWLIGGVILVEAFFLMPGVGNMFITGLKSYDYPVIVGGIMTLSYCCIATAIVFDLLIAGITYAAALKIRKGGNHVWEKPSQA